MQTLQIDKENARKLYPAASKEFKQMLVDTFGEKFFSQKITDRVKTFEDACSIMGVSSCSFFNSSDTEDEKAYKKLKVIIAALNESWVPDWNNSNERKWRPWFYLDSPGFQLYYVYYCYTYSNVSSRLCFKSEELANYAANQFLDIYKTFFTS
jgi:hypothetical protein